MGDFYGTGIEIWAGITEKKRFGPIMSNFIGRFFHGQKNRIKIKTL